MPYIRRRRRRRNGVSNDDGGGNNSGNNETKNPNTPPNTGPKPNKNKDRIKNLKINPQLLKHSCVTAVVSYLEDLFCGGDSNTDYRRQKNANAMYKKIGRDLDKTPYFNNSQIEALLKLEGIQYSNANTDGQIRNHLDNGGVAINWIKGDEGQNDHEVLIYDHDDKGNYITIDPHDGQSRTYAAGDFGSPSYSNLILDVNCNKQYKATNYLSW